MRKFVAIMGKELVSLENGSFAAWGCKACGWIVPRWKVSGKPPQVVSEAFEKHDCAKFPRTLPRKVGAPKRLPKV